MPKEFINDHAEPGQPFIAAVGFQRDGLVQLGIQVQEPQTDLLGQLHANNREQVEGIGRVALHWFLTEGRKWDWDTLGENDDLCVGLGHAVLGWVRQGGQYDPERDGIWVTLSRHGVNTLIRYARKARDAAYGRDE